MINPSVKQLMSLDTRRVWKYFQRLVRLNARTLDDEVSVTSWRMGLVQRFHQLPCTRLTREKRCDLIATYCDKGSSIVILGDDDKVSVSLIRRGYSNVIVYECDDKVLQGIREELTLVQQKSLRLIQADITQLSQLIHHRADLVLMDPPYHNEGLDAFLRAALSSTRMQPDATLILMTDPRLFYNRARDWDRVESLLGPSWRLQSYRIAFNAYPLSGSSALLLRAFALLHAPRTVFSRKRFYYFSDCCVWRSASRVL